MSKCVVSFWIDFFIIVLWCIIRVRFYVLLELGLVREIYLFYITMVCWVYFAVSNLLIVVFGICAKFFFIYICVWEKNLKVIYFISWLYVVKCNIFFNWDVYENRIGNFLCIYGIYIGLGF